MYQRDARRASIPRSRFVSAERCVGVLAGLVAALALTRFMPTDPATFATGMARCGPVRSQLVGLQCSLWVEPRRAQGGDQARDDRHPENYRGHHGEHGGIARRRLE